MGAALLAIARTAAVPVCVHLDHATREELVREAVDLGLPSVMYDGSAHDDEENRSRTTAITTWCHERGASVEAELGEVGGKDGVHAPGARTDPADAAEFVAATGVDALAVAVGSSHAMTTRDARLDAEDLEAGVVDAAELREERWRELGVVDAGPTEHLDDFEFA